MKKIGFFLMLIVVLYSCGSNSSESSMIVTGNVKGLKKGTLYLQHIPDSVLVTIDSLKIAGDGNFNFEIPLDHAEIFYLYLDKTDNNDINDRITFFGEPGTITINTAWNTFDTKARISGSETHKKLEEYREVMSRFNSKNLEYLQAAFDPEVQQDSLAMDSIQRASDRNLVRGYLYAINFALNNKDSEIAPYIAVKEVPDANAKYLDSVYTVLSPEVADSKYGKELRSYLDKIKTAE
ncbi:DUF4369 domain-containing protein [Poritiphilus flavus]|uniref:DUF4369 domain-containing protein n=1 Tax=Poritiphilus flavus TaxID=2697053 RepID=A0A6L9EB76_9FLAO|nr:DUF4369 domain-containing protein [Poritiphilus flavus]NAS11832.1 DUF4369 domain-containing protein [Poritiphilus flavus]